MHRFFVRPEQIAERRVRITGSDVRHIEKVLRLGCGDQIQVTDGRGKEFLCVIEDLQEDAVVAKLAAVRDNASEPPLRVHLLQAVAKGDRMDYCVQKATEVGVYSITPVMTERVVVKLAASKAIRRRERWQRIAAEAAKQSGRGRVPEVRDVIDLSSALSGLPEGVPVILPWEAESARSLQEVLRTPACRKAEEVVVLIGPEGGFARQEVERAMEAGASPVTLGPRILRTETAGPLTIALILYELGDIGKGRDDDEDWRYF